MVNPVQLFKVAVPGLIGALGLGKWLRERALRVPIDHVADAVANANLLLRAQGEGTITIAQWRAVEATQAQILGDGIAAKVTPK